MNQSELNTSNRCQARENMEPATNVTGAKRGKTRISQVTIGLVFTFDWVKKNPHTHTHVCSD